MAKTFMYVCFGILALAVAFHLGARYGSGSVVGDYTTGVVAVSLADYHRLLLDTGEVWRWDQTDFSWEQLTDWSPPVPITQIKFWEGKMFISASDELWFCDAGVWQNIGTPPGLVATQPTAWGEIKAEFGE